MLANTGAGNKSQHVMYNPKISTTARFQTENDHFHITHLVAQHVRHRLEDDYLQCILIYKQY